MAEKEARNKGAKRAVTGEPTNRNRIKEYQCRRDPNVVIKLTSGKRKKRSFVLPKPKNGRASERSN